MQESQFRKGTFEASHLCFKSSISTAATQLNTSADSIHLKYLETLPPQAQETWHELLQRPSDAAFAMKSKKITKPSIVLSDHTHVDVPVKSAANILLPPLTQKEPTEVEDRLGTIPPIIKQMSQHSKGFQRWLLICSWWLPRHQRIRAANVVHAVFWGGQS